MDEESKNSTRGGETTSNPVYEGIITNDRKDKMNNQTSQVNAGDDVESEDDDNSTESGDNSTSSSSSSSNSSNSKNNDNNQQKFTLKLGNDNKNTSNQTNDSSSHIKLPTVQNQSSHSVLPIVQKQQSYQPLPIVSVASVTTKPNSKVFVLSQPEAVKYQLMMKSKDPSNSITSSPTTSPKVRLIVKKSTPDIPSTTITGSVIKKPIFQVNVAPSTGNVTQSSYSPTMNIPKQITQGNILNISPIDFGRLIPPGVSVMLNSKPVTITTLSAAKTTPSTKETIIKLPTVPSFKSESKSEDTSKSIDTNIKTDTVNSSQDKKSNENKKTETKNSETTITSDKKGDNVDDDDDDDGEGDDNEDEDDGDDDDYDMESTKSDLDTHSIDSARTSTPKLSREIQQLQKTVSESKVLSEFINDSSPSAKKDRKSRKQLSNSQPIQHQENNDTDYIPSGSKFTKSRSRSGSPNSLRKWLSEERINKRTNMRSQNSEFVQKQMKFLNRIHQNNDIDSDNSDTEMQSMETKSVSAVEHHYEILKRNFIPSHKPGKDAFCWKCVKCRDLITCCKCPRSYHLKCLKSQAPLKNYKEWTCPECNNTESALKATIRSGKPGLTQEHLNYLLKFAVQRMSQLKGYEHFIHGFSGHLYPEYDKFILNPVTIDKIRKKIDNKHYKCSEEFISEAKWILHNAAIYFGNNSKYTNLAKQIVKICRQEANEIEICPECYNNANTKHDWFIEVCSRPHILLWAKLKGFPFWPAKSMNVNSSGLVNVRFFGAHDRARVPLKDCYLYSEDDPNPTTKQLAKKHLISSSVQEIAVHIRKIKEKFGTFNYAPTKTLYDPNRELEQLESMIPGVIEYIKKAELSQKPTLTFKIVKTADNNLSMIKKTDATGSDGNESTSEKSKRTENDNTIKSKRISIDKDRRRSLSSASLSALKKKQMENAKLTPPPSSQTVPSSSSANISASDVKTYEVVSRKRNETPTENNKIILKRKSENWNASTIASVPLKKRKSFKQSQEDKDNLELANSSSTSEKNKNHEKRKSNVNDEEDGGKSQKQAKLQKQQSKDDIVEKIEERLSSRLEVTLKKTKISKDKNPPQQQSGPEEKSKSTNDSNKDAKKMKNDAAAKAENQTVTNQENTNIKKSIVSKQMPEISTTSIESRVVKTTNHSKNVDKTLKSKLVDALSEKPHDKQSSNDQQRPVTIVVSEAIAVNSRSTPDKNTSMTTNVQKTNNNEQQILIPECEIKKENVEQNEQEQQEPDLACIPNDSINTTTKATAQFSVLPSTTITTAISTPVVTTTASTTLSSATLSTLNPPESIVVKNEICSDDEQDTLHESSITIPQVAMTNVVDLPTSSSVVTSTQNKTTDKISLQRISVRDISTMRVQPRKNDKKFINVGTNFYKIEYKKRNQRARKSFPSSRIQFQPIAPKPIAATLTTLIPTTPTLSLSTSTSNVTISPKPIHQYASAAAAAAFSAQLKQNANNMVYIPIDTTTTSTRPATIAAQKAIPVSTLTASTKSPNNTQQSSKQQKNQQQLQIRTVPVIGSNSSTIMENITIPRSSTIVNAPNITSITSTDTNSSNSIGNQNVTVATAATTTTMTTATIAPVTSTTVTSTAATTPTNTYQTPSNSALQSRQQSLGSQQQQQELEISSSPEHMLSGFVTPSLASAITDAIVRGPPKLTPKPSGPFTSDGRSIFPSEAGPASRALMTNSYKLADFFRSVIEDTLSHLSNLECPDAKIQLLELEMENLKMAHAKELAELKHNTDVMLCEMKKSAEKEKQCAIIEVRQKCEAERMHAIEETKNKLWCKNCSKEAQFYCCWATSYCSHQCQQLHWPRHRNTCTQTRGDKNNVDTNIQRPATKTQTIVLSKPSSAIINNNKESTSTPRTYPSAQTIIRSVPQVSQMIHQQQSPSQQLSRNVTINSRAVNMPPKTRYSAFLNSDGNWDIISGPVENTGTTTLVSSSNAVASAQQKQLQQQQQQQQQQQMRLQLTTTNQTSGGFVQEICTLRNGDTLSLNQVLNGKVTLTHKK